MSQGSITRQSPGGGPGFALLIAPKQAQMADRVSGSYLLTVDLAKACGMV